jgi:photosystem II stability/assembly factor-like uncharacterized protein
MQQKPLAVSVLLFCLFNATNAQWTIKHLNETSFSYENIIKFRDDSLGLFMGDNSVIMKTGDAGETWEAREPGTQVHFRDFQFVSDSVIYAVGDSKLMKSTDAGDTWYFVHGISGKYLYSLWFVNSDSGVVAGWDGIYRTVDGGNSWDTAWSITQSGYKFGELEQLNFPTAQTGYAIGRGVCKQSSLFEHFVLKSGDSGATWDSIKTFSRCSLASICFINRDTGFIGGGSGVIYKTSDGGTTWTESRVAENGVPVKSIRFISEMKGFAAGGIMVIFLKNGVLSIFFIAETKDGGETWMSYDTTGIPLNSIWYVNDTLGFVSGDYELIMKSNGPMDILPGDYPWYLIESGDIEEKMLPDSRINIYPNPTAGILFVRNMNPNNPIESIKLLNGSGKSVDVGNTVSENDLFQLDLSELTSGIYLIKIIFADNIEVEKIIKVN